MLVKLTQDTTHRKSGEVIDVDDASAAALIAASRAEAVEDGNTTAEVAREPRGRGIVTAVQVVDADPYPGDAAAAEQPAAQPAAAVDAPMDRDAQIKHLVDNNQRDELVALAAATTKQTADTFGDLNKTQIAEKIVDASPQQ